MRTVSTPETAMEAFATLSDLARRKVSPLPPEWVAALVLSIATGADFPVQRAALDALVRRLRFANRDDLRVKKRPAAGRKLGTYSTARVSGASGKAETRPYETRVTRLTPLAASCSCPDFVRSSLGVCKHILCVLCDLFGDPKQLAAAAIEQAPKPAKVGASVYWMPHLPLLGPNDRARGLRLVLSGRAKAPTAMLRASDSPPRLDLGSPWLLLEGNPWAAAKQASAPLAGQESANAVFAPMPEVLDDLERRVAWLKFLCRADADVEPAARTVIAEELQRAERLLHNRTRAQVRRATLKTVKRKLYPYQEEGISRFLETGRLLLADDMGLGKTTQAVAACHALFHSGEVRRGLLIVPAALKTQWGREWVATSDVPLTVLQGIGSERQAKYRQLKSGFIVIGYEQLLKDFEQVLAWAPDLVVLDEAQRIKNWATKSAVYVKALSPRFRLVLTGTPMENRLEELASILDWVDDVALAPKWRLEAWHTINESNAAGGIGGVRHLDTLRTRLSTCVVRRVRQDVLKQLPSRMDTRVPVVMTPQQRDEHDAHTQPIKDLMARGQRRPLTQGEFLKLMQHLTLQRIVSNGLGQLHFDELWPTYSKALPDAALLEGMFSPKLLEFRRLIEDLVTVQDRKVVVFSQWRRMLRLASWSVREILGSRGRRAVFFTGAESQQQRTQSIVEFHDDPHTSVMFLSDAGGVGLNLQHAASACINLELPWNPAVLEQRIGRIYRLGQRRPIDVYNLVTEYGIESRIAALVASKKAVFSGLFDGTSNEVRFEGRRSFMADVEKLVAQVPDVLVPAPNDATAADELDFDEGALAEVREPSETAPSDLNMRPPTAEADEPRDAGLALSPIAVAKLLASVEVVSRADGGLTISAPAEAAATLTALFEGMARLIAPRTQ